MTAVARLIGSYDDLIDAIRVRVDELSLSREGLDDISGLPVGYSGKLLGPSRNKSLGRSSFGDMLGAIGCKLVLIEDPVATARTLARRQPVDRRQQRFGGPPRGIGAKKHHPPADANAIPKRKRPGKYD
jgi:hypothetical protein